MFYIQPPKGLVTLHTLEETVFTRLEYLNTLGNERNQTFNGKFEYLLEGSSHDCVGHFALRFLISRSDELFLYWIEKETALFRRRLSLIQSKQSYRLFKTILRHIRRRNESCNPVDAVLMDIGLFYLKPKIFKHISSKNHHQECTEYHTKIDFELIPDLTEKKVVELSRGLATVYCSQWKGLLQSLFQSFITLEMKSHRAIINHFFADPRMNAIRHKLYHYLFSKGYNFGKITASNIDDEALNFPPCMAHLHLELRRKHRLSHYARFYYTLFLKECGMNLEEAMKYWSNEYSKPHSCTALCIHDWQTDAKKFTYSIRHMYGLEGGRKNYKTPNCRNICGNIPGAKYEGGCPFRNFDIEALKTLLRKSMSDQEIEQFMASTFQENPQEKCAKFFKFKSTASISDVTITKPVQYYLQMIELN